MYFSHSSQLNLVSKYDRGVWPTAVRMGFSMPSLSLSVPLLVLTPPAKPASHPDPPPVAALLQGGREGDKGGERQGGPQLTPSTVPSLLSPPAYSPSHVILF